MLITLCYVYMWIRFHKCYTALIRNSLSSLNSSSFSFSIRTSSAASTATTLLTRGHKVPCRCPILQTHEDAVFLQLGDKVVHVTEPQVWDDFSKWTVLLGSSFVSIPQKENISFIIEATGHQVVCDSQQNSNKKVLKWSNYCLPLAHSQGHPFRAVAQATVDNFSQLGVAFIEDRLLLDNGLVPSKIVPVVLQESTLSELLRKQGPLSPNLASPWLDSMQTKESVLEPFPRNQLTNHHTECHKGSILLSPETKIIVDKRRGSDPLQGSQDLRLGSGADSEDLGNHRLMGDHGQHLHLSSCHECLEMENSTILSVKYASAENIPELPDDNLVERVIRAKTQDENKQDVGGNHSQSDGLISNTKPPNVLVYTGGCQERFQVVCQLLSECINIENNIIYPLQPQQALKDPWMENTKLLILAEEENLTLELQTCFLTYLSQGGKVLGLTSSLCPAGLCLEVRENQRQRVRKLSFIKEDSTELELSVLVSGKVFTRDLQGNGEVELWGELKEESLHQRDMVIIRITHGQDGGEAVLSQVHLEISPEKLKTDKFDELKLNNALRYKVLAELLISLGLCCELNQTVAPTAIHLLPTSLKAKAIFLKWLETQVDQNGVLTLSKSSLRLVSCSELQETHWLPEGSLALVTESKESFVEFNMETYRKNLKTSLLGHTVLYAETVSSTMDLLEGMPLHLPKDVGLIFIAGRQRQGRGRGKNTWLSPLGCAMFTLKVEIELSSRLGQRIPFVQHLAALAVVEAVRTLPGYEDIELRVKWPNDIYYNNLMKLGGVLVTSTVLGPTFHLLIGCGFNVTNSNPTVCINDLILQYNLQHNCCLQLLSCAQLIARTVSCLNALINSFQRGGPDTVLPIYYKRWLHSGTKIHLGSEDGLEAEVLGLDKNGFLQVISKELGVVSVEPDGNSFDMLRNLVIIKQH